MCFDEIIARHIDWIYRAAYRFYCHRPDAEDLAQDTLLRLWLNSDKYELSRQFKPWALTIMTNIFKNRNIRSQRVAFAPLSDCVDSISSDYTDTSANIADIASVVRRCARMSKCIDCVILFAKGYSGDEIADKLGIRAATVRSRIVAGRALIARELDNY